MDKQLTRFGCFLLLCPSFVVAQIASPIVQGQHGTAVNTLMAHYLMIQGTNAQRIYNSAYQGARTNIAPASDDFTGWSVSGGGTPSVNQMAFAASASSLMYGNDSYLGSGQFAGVAGTYTMTVEAKLPSGSGTFRLCVFNAGSGWPASSDFTLSTSWQKFSWSWTGTPVSGLAACVENGTAGTAQTVQIRNLRFNQGSSDLGAEHMPVWDGWLGKTSYVEASFDPAYSATGLNFGTGTNFMGGVRLPSDTTMTANSFYVLFKINGDGSGAVTPYLAPVLGQYNSPCAFCVMTSSTRQYPAWASNNAAPDIYPNDGNYHVLAYVGSDVNTNNAAWYLDGLQMNYQTGRAGGQLWTNPSYLNGFQIGNGSLTSGFPGEIDDIMIFNSAHTPAQVVQNTQAMWAEVAARGIAPTTFSKFLVVDGDSISEMAVAGGVDYPAKYPMVAAHSQTPYLHNRSFAVSGNTCPNRTAAIPTGAGPFLSPPYLPAGVEVGLFIYCGTNDIGLSNATITAAQVHTNMVNYVTAARAAGYTKIAIATLMPFSEGTAGCAGNNPVRDAANTLLRADKAGADILVDWAADPTMGTDAACGNATYYADGTHPTAAGHAIMATYLETALPSLLP